MYLDYFVKFVVNLTGSLEVILAISVKFEII